MAQPAAGAGSGPLVQIETERKFALLPGATMPTLEGLAVIGEAETTSLDAVYFDSPAYELNRSRITLRRRTGGADEAWHLKLPKGSTDRSEVHVPLADSPDPVLVPTELRRIVNDQVGYVPLVPVARLQTERTLRILSDPETGTPLAELAHDVVTASRMALPGIGDQSSTWTEIEVELLPGGTRDFLDEVTEHLSWSGIVQASSPSKVTQALGDAPEWAASRTLDTDTPLAEVVLAAMAVHVGVLQGRAEDVRVDAPDAVHKTRVASRRLRSILQVFRSLFDRESVDALRAELKWYAERLGHARDAEVQKERLFGLLDWLPQEAVVGPVGERMETELEGTHQEALRGVAEVFAGGRYRDLQVALVGLLSDPPLVGDDVVLTGTAAPRMLTRAMDKVRRADATAEQSEGTERLEALHEVRKKAKVVRYACEALSLAYGEPAGDAAKAWSEVTEVFGEMNDMAVSRERLVGLAEAAAAQGEPTFTYGVLFGTQLGSFESTMPAAQAALARAVRRGPGSWTGGSGDGDGE